jgi:hypothetical protein
VAWTTSRPIADEEVERCVAALAALGCSLPQFDVDSVEDRYVAVRHRQTEELLLEFGFASDSPGTSSAAESARRGLVQDGQIAWNWCCTGRRQPETGLIIHKFRLLQAITGDKLLVWDDDGMCHWSWGSCRLEEAGIDPFAVVDAHLKHAPVPFVLQKAS